MNKKINSTTYMMAAGHFLCDMNQGALPAILPFLMTKYHFTYTGIAGLILAANLISSIIQPLIGHYADKKSKKWMLPIGLLLSSGGIAAIGILSSYWVIFSVAMISGIGTAIFHPEAAKTVNKASSKYKASNMSFFSLGGTLGFALGPIVSTTSILLWGLKGIMILIIPTTLFVMVMLKAKNNIRPPEKIEKNIANKVEFDQGKAQWKSFSLLSILLCIRSVVFYGLNTFLPLFWINILLQSKSDGTSMLSIFLLFGAIGTLIGGRLADRFGYVTTTKISFVSLFPLLCLLAIAKNTLFATIILLFVGIFIFLPYSSMVVLGQKYLPNRLGLASGITLGLAVSVGGIAAPLLGKIADTYGIQTVMIVISCISLVSTIFSFILSNEKEKIEHIQA
jgi:FSR family fosmidomycin resistance protein-like MFS transporter